MRSTSSIDIIYDLEGKILQLHHCINYCIVQPHDFSLFGVHPTCSVSMINSGPAVPFDPPESRQKDRTQYVIPGSKFMASPVTILPSTCTDNVVFPAGFVH